MTPRPPRLTRALLSLLVPPEDREFLVADLDDAFARRVREAGPAAARRWYRAQLVRSLPLALRALGELARGGGLSDIRAALRVLRRRPLYAVGVSGTLALGVAAAVVLGGIAWRVWLRPLPFPDSERLVRVYELGRPNDEGARDRGRISPPLLHDLRESEWTQFEGFAGLSGTNPEWIVDGELRPLLGQAVSPGFFDLVGTTTVAGRTAWASRTGAEVPEVVLSEAFWRNAFGADPSIVGRTIDLDGASRTVIGVVRQEGGWPAPVDVFTPLVFESRQLGEGMRGARYLEVVARIGAASTVESATAEFTAFVESLGDEHPIHDGWTGEIVSLREDLTGPFRDVLRLLLAAGAAFLLLAVVNVTGLTSTRALEARRENAVRRALGSSRARILRGAWVEGALLGALGGGAALLGAALLLPRSVAWLPANLARSGEVGLSAGFALLWGLIAVAVGGGVGLLSHAVTPTTSDLRSGARTTRGGRAGPVLVAGQLALTTLLIGVGMRVLERSQELSHADVGFATSNVQTAFVNLPRSTHEDVDARRDSWAAILADLEAAGLPAALSTNLPMSGMNANYGFSRPGDANESFAQYTIVSPRYFEVMEIPVLAGRTIAPGETGSVIVISDRLAEAHFPGEDPVGRTLLLLSEEFTIVGVVGSTSHFGPDAPVVPQMYVTFESVNWDFGNVVVRGGPDAGRRLADAVERTVPGATRPDVVAFESIVSAWFRPLRIQLGIVGALGLLGAVLAGLGLYANIAYQVRGQLPELGIRVALGATRGRIVGRVVRHGLTVASAGLAIGLVATWGTRERLDAVLGTPDAALSPAIVAVTALLVVLLSVTGVALPALRASRADPLETLRTD